MCRKVSCSKCGKATWAGCGMHIEQALAGVPDQDRCKCNEGAQTAPSVSAANAKPFGFASLFK